MEGMDPKAAAAAATESMKDLKLTEDEVGKFEKAFKDPEFMKMFMEYAQEVSDPKNRAETEAYLQQIEGEGRAEEVYGKGVELVAPKAGYVVKTHNRANKEKVFINVCYTDKLDDYKETKKAGGMDIKVPYSLGPVRREKDKKGDECDTHDFAVSTTTYMRADSDPRFKRFLCETAIENVQSQRGGKLDASDFTLPKMKYKGEGLKGPQTMAFRRSVDGKDPGGAMKQPPGKLGAMAGAAAAAGVGGGGKAGGAEADVLEKIRRAEAGAPDKGAKSTFSFDQGRKDRAAKKAPPPAPKEGEAGWVNELGEKVPKHEVVHRGQVDLQTTWRDPNTSEGNDTAGAFTRSRPEALVVKVELPELESIKGVDLDVGPARVEVHFPGKYHLVIKLPHEVEEEAGKARFDKQRRVLEVTLPVRKESEPSKTFTEPDPDQEPDILEVMEKKKGMFGNLAPVPLHGNGAGSGDGGEAEAEGGAEEPPPKEGEAERAEREERERVWKEYCARNDKKAKEAESKAAKEREAEEAAAREAILRARSEEARRIADLLTAGAGAAGEPLPFLAAEAFAGWQEGYVFKTGGKGLGYYLDAKPGAGAGAGGEIGAAVEAEAPDASAASAVAEEEAQGVRLKPRLNRAVLDELD